MILGMGLAGNDDLDWAVFGIEQLLEASDIAEDERGALVCSKATGKANGESIRVEYLFEAAELCGAGIAAVGGADGALADKLNHLALLFSMDFPEFSRGDIFDVVPDLGIGVAFAPIGLEVLVV